MNNFHSRRPGFTLIELTVVVLVIGILAALILPAIQKARESSRSIQCLSNLRQLGTALNSYAQSMGALPMMTNGRRGFSMHSMILPQLERINLYNSLNFNNLAFDESNSTIYNTKLAAFICPSDHAGGRPGPWLNYAGCVGYGFQVHRKFNGVFAKRPDQPATFSTITDGSSNTAMASEWMVGTNSDAIIDRDGSIFNTRRRVKPGEYDEFINECININLSQVKKAMGWKGLGWLSGDMGKTLYNHDLNINNRSCANGDLFLEGAWTASSRHGDGSNVMFADSRVKFVKASLNIAVWRAISTRSGGEMISADQY